MSKRRLCMKQNRLLRLAAVGVGVCLTVGVNAGVQVEALPDLTLDEVGIATPFLPDIWSGSSVAHLIQSIGQVSRLSLSPEERVIFRDLVMTDVSGAATVREAGGDFFAARVQALMTQGLFEDVIVLIDQVSDSVRTPDMKRWRKEALVGLGQSAAACLESEMGHWGTAEKEMRVVCSFLNGTDGQASLAFDIYQEEKGADAWITAVGHKRWRQNGQVPAGHPAVSQVVPVVDSFGLDVMTDDWSRGLLRAVALSPQIEGDVRVRAAERIGASAADWEKIVADIGDKKSALKRVTLYQKLGKATGKEQVNAIREWVAELKKEGVLQAWAPVVTAVVLPLQPEADMAADVLPVLIRANELTAAQAWYDVLYAAHPVKALPFASGLDVMGAGAPETIDALVSDCIQQKSCDTVLRGIPFYFPVSPAVAVQVPLMAPVGYPGFVTAAIHRQIEAGTVGEGVLNALLLLGRSDTVERPLIEVLAKVVPAGVSAAVLRERLYRGY